jgi:hypothetical protein
MCFFNFLDKQPVFIISFLSEIGEILYLHPPSGKYLKNAPKFKSSVLNNSVSAAFVTQILCENGMLDKYLSNYNIEN